ncbi:MAG: efflux RND transporter permease subunit [Bacteroidales bacterium]
MVRFLIHRPIAVFMVVLALTCFGVVAWFKIPLSLMPNIDIPEIGVYFNLPGKSAPQIERQVLQSLRKSLQQVDNINSVESKAKNEAAIVKLRLSYDADVQRVYFEINEQIDQMMSLFPKDITRPLVVKASTNDIPTFYVDVFSKSRQGKSVYSLSDLSVLAEKVVKPYFEQLKEIGFVDIGGASFSEIRIQLKQPQCDVLGINETDLLSILREEHEMASDILLQEGMFKYILHFGATLNSIDQIKKMWISLPQGRKCQIGDIAELEKHSLPPKGFYFADNNPAILLAVSKQADARMEDLSQNIGATLSTLQQLYPDLQFRVNRDQSTLLKYSISSLLQSLLLGIILSLLISFVFIKRWRESLIILISIPVSLIIVLFCFYFLDFSLNILSLSGLILGLGMMIDNSIIVVENIGQYVKKGINLEESCVVGSEEMIKPLLSSMLTTCSVFFPLIFLNDLTGAIFLEQAIAIGLSLAISYLFSILVLPVLYFNFYKGKNNFLSAYCSKSQEDSRLDKIYFLSVKKLFCFPRLAILGFISLIFIGIFLFFFVPRSGLPEFRDKDVVVKIKWNQSISLQENQKRVKNLFNAIPDLNIRWHIQCGESGLKFQKKLFHEAEYCSVYVDTHSFDELGVFSNEFTKQMKKAYPEASLDFSRPKRSFEQIFAQSKDFLTFRFYPNPKDKMHIGKEDYVKGVLDSLSLLKTNYKLERKPCLHLVINRKKLLLYDISYNKMLEILERNIGCTYDMIIPSEGNYMPLRIKKESEYFFESFNNLKVSNATGELFSIKEFIKTSYKEDQKQVCGDIRGVYYDFPLNDSKVEEVQEKVTTLKKNRPRWTCLLTGSYYDDQEMFEQFSLILLLGVFILYFILAAQFESFLQPLIVLIEIFFDLCAIFMLLIISGQSLNLMSGIGIVVVSGIIINDSILKMDTMNRLRRKGVSVEQAIHIAGKLRLRPILMTSLTTILALIPLFFSSGLGADLQKPMAIVIVGGMLLGTLISLYFIPLAYFLIYSSKNKRI